MAVDYIADFGKLLLREHYTLTNLAFTIQKSALRRIAIPFLDNFRISDSPGVGLVGREVDG
jgi:hypothetical protein